MRIYLLILFISLIGCKESQLKSSGSQNSLSDAAYYVSAETQVRVFQQASTDIGGLGIFVTNLSSAEGVLQIPSTVLKDDYGDRRNSSVPQPLDLVVKAYHPGHPSGDFIFEAPLLGPDVKISNVTTALYWFLKWGYNNSSLKISQDSFASISTSAELLCSDCRAKKTSEVLTLIQNQNSLRQSIQTILNRENPNLSLSYSWSSPGLYYAWSSPVLTLNGYGAQTSKQLETIKPSILGVYPEDSSKTVLPISWTLTRLDNTSIVLAGGDLIYTFSNEDQVAVDFKPTFANSSMGAQITLHYEVAKANQAPVCTEPIALTMKANRISSVALTDHCYDPDNDPSDPNAGVTYALVSGPSGLTINNSGTLKWTPTNADVGNSNEFQVLVTSSSSVSHVATGVVTVTPVQLPTFTGDLSGISFTEGVIQSINVEFENQEEDPLMLTVATVIGGGILQSGSPAGAGTLNSYSQIGTDAAPVFVWDFMPSYYQTIAVTGSLTLRFIVRYNTAVDSSLDGTQILATKDVTFSIINSDDPPLWDLDPQDDSLTEGQVFNIPLGSAHDPNPNPTALTYRLLSLNPSGCSWNSTVNLTTDGSGNPVLTGYPSYDSTNNCSFQIIATDAVGLVSNSQTVTYTVADTNRPIQEIPGVITQVDGVENLTLSLPISEMFSDEDIDADDPRETLSWTCNVNTDGSADYSALCSSLNIAFTLSTNSLSGSWFPIYGTAGTYYIKLSVTDFGGATASHLLKLVIAASPAPMILTVEQNNAPTTEVIANEGVSNTMMLRVRAQSADPVNQYTYNVSSPTCYVIGGAGTCRAAMIVSPSLEGTGDQDFVFTIVPAYTDGNSTYPESSKRYIVTFTVAKSDDANVQSQTSVTLTMNNTNRAPTAIGLSGGSQGCAGSNANSLTTAFTVCINLSQNSKTGNTWQKSYSVNLSPVDPDTTNDSYSYSFTATSAPGSISTSGVWTIKLPACLSPGTSTVTRTYYLQLSDGRGGTVTREITVKFQNALAPSSCL